MAGRMNIVALLMSCIVLCARSQTYPAAGAYLSLGAKEIQAITGQVTADLNNEIRNAKIPEQKGSASVITYDLTEFVTWSDFESFTFSSTGPNQLTVGWSEVQLFMSTHYHICLKGGVICESGYIYVNTPNYNQKTLTLEVNLDLQDNGKAKLSYDGVQLNVQDGDLMVWVICKDTVCVIPTGKIHDEIADQIIPQMTSAIQNAVNNVATKYVDNLPLEVPVKLGKFGNIKLDLETQWYLSPVKSGPFVPGAIVAMKGAVDAQPGGQGDWISAPFTYDNTPTDSELQNPAYNMEFYISDFLLSTGFWAMGELNVFTQEVTNDEIPAALSLHLLANDSTFQAAAPGLAAYDGCLLKVDTKLNTFTPLSIDANGIHTEGNSVSLQFSIYNETFSMVGWVVDVDFGVDLIVNISGTPNNITITPSVSNINPNVTVALTNIGDISTDTFVALVNLILGAIPIPSKTIELPKGLTNQGQELITENGFMKVGVNYNYQVPLSSHVQRPVPVVELEAGDVLKTSFPYVMKN